MVQSGAAERIGGVRVFGLPRRLGKVRLAEVRRLARLDQGRHPRLLPGFGDAGTLSGVEIAREATSGCRGAVRATRAKNANRVFCSRKASDDRFLISTEVEKEKKE